LGFNSSGIYSRQDGTRTTWVDDATNGVKIEADLHDNHDNDLADALSQTILKDGRSIITGNISFSGKKIINLADGTPGSTDAANMSQLAALKEFSTGITITGADANGRITFQGSGVNGLAWTAQDISWIARSAKSGEALNRLALNNSVNPSLTVPYGDVFVIDEGGFVNFGGHLMTNGAYDGSWRTVSPGTLTLARLQNSALDLFANQTPTITNSYAVAALRQFIGLNGLSGNTTMTMAASSSGNQNQIQGSHVGVARWNLRLGNDEGLGGGNTGANFDLLAYDDSGNYRQQVLRINRADGVASFNGQINANAGIAVNGTISATAATIGTLTHTGNMTVNGNSTVAGSSTAAHFVATNSTYFGSAGLAVLSAQGVGAINLRPTNNATDQFIVTSNGGIQLCNGSNSPTGGAWLGMGFRSHTQSNTGAYGDEFMNFNYNGTSTGMYAADELVGTIPKPSDYRIKRAIQPLASTWEAVKSLNPISYKQRGFRDLIKDREELQWGFVAHELQEQLTPSAASGEKDGPDLQHPDLLGLIAAVTKALQEAMTRIEALEAAA
jgi:hypothetical protein